MSSPFEARCSAVASSTATRFSGESVVVQTAKGTRKTATAVIQMEEPIRPADADGPTILEGRFNFAASDRDTLLPDKRTPLTIEARGYTWFVMDVSHDRGGMFEMFVRNELADQSNEIDLGGNLHEYG